MQEKTAVSLSRLRDASTLNKLIALGAALAVAVVGYTLFLTRAAGPFVTVEPELGTVSTPATIGQDAAASAGKLVTFGASAGGTGKTYYVDCNGNDSNNGTVETTPWRTLSKASGTSVAAGDSVVLKRGCTFSGTLRTGPSGSPWKGTPSNPVRVGTYGTGATPIISNNVDNTANVDVTGSYITIDGLSLKGIATEFDSGCKNNPEGYILGVAFNSGATNNTLTNTTMTGFYAGVYVLDGSSGNHIVGNTFTKNDMMMPNDPGGDNDAGAFAVLLWGDNNEIGYNTMNDHAACSYDYGSDGAAVEMYGGRGNVIHHNKAINTDSFTEMGDPRSANNTYAYNLHVSTLPTSVFFITRGAGDGLGPVNGTKLYNNTAYLTGADSQGVVCYGGCTSAILSMKNNILWIGWKALYADAAFDESNNIYWRTGGSPFIQSPSISSTSKQQDPKFVANGSDYHLQASSPAINAGSNAGITAGFTQDLDKMTVPAGAATDIGAYEYGSTPTSGGTGGCAALPTTLGAVTSTVTVPSNGTYRVWSRLKVPDTTKNSYWLVVDGNCQINVGDGAIPAGSWTWVNSKDGGATPIDLTLTAGTHTLKFVGREGSVALDRVLLLTDMNCTPSGNGDNCTAAADVTAPTVGISSPTANQNVTGTLNITATASDNSGGSGIGRVEYYLDGSPTAMGSAVSSPYSYSWNAAAAGKGQHTITAYAFDKSGNKSAPASVVINVVDPNDTSAPTAPSALKTTAVTVNSIALSWTASTDNKGIAGYKIYRNNQYRATATGTTFSDTGLSAKTQYIYTISAYDAAGNESVKSGPLTVTTATGGDTTAPTAPTNVRVTAVATNKVSLAWNASTDASGIARYLVQRNGAVIAQPSGTSFDDTTALPGTTYNYAVYAVDTANNASVVSNFVSATTPVLVDRQAPSTPTELTPTVVKARQITLQWKAAADNVGVAGYKIFRGNQQIGTTSSLSYADATVSPTTSYSYTVVAYDAAGNSSGKSTAVTVRTPAPVTKTLQFLPRSDSYVARDQATRNYGARTVLKVDGQPVERTMVKFIVEGTAGKRVVNAKLRMFVYDGSKVSGGVVYGMPSNEWNEREVTWSNAPQFGNMRLGTFGPVKQGTWVEKDVSAFVKGDATYSLGIIASNADEAYYNSEEAGGNRPWLYVTVE